MEKRIEFLSGENLLRGKLFIPKGKGPFASVIFFHGSGSRGQKYFEAGKILAKKGFLSLSFNFSGCGESEGEYLSQTHLDAFNDARSAYKFLLHQKMIDKNRIGIVGGSFGGYIASMILPETEVKSLVLLSPSAHDDSFNTKIEMGSLKKEVEYFKNEYNWLDSEAFKNISKFKGSLLVIRAENDENIPEEVYEKYVECAKTKDLTSIILKGADHRLSTDKMRNQFYEMLVKWFIKTL